MKRTPQWGLRESGPEWWMGCEREAWKRVNSQEVVGGMGSQGWRERMYQGQIAKKMPLQWQTQDSVYYSQAMHVHGCCFPPSMHVGKSALTQTHSSPFRKPFFLCVVPCLLGTQSNCSSLRHITPLICSSCNSVRAKGLSITTSQVIRHGDNPG